jgi:hypothetical protein
MANWGFEAVIDGETGRFRYRMDEETANTVRRVAVARAAPPEAGARNGLRCSIPRPVPFLVFAVGAVLVRCAALEVDPRALDVCTLTVT